ncbi:hypothetical protein PVIIG_05695 [Plasmodium vivax India VII]|uniref:Uncharacterized protein n=1 Tax=Plasmodium vivax India VII TaxID=1077284 RepID=A0A0J9S269_PLAVI|nr:hypothetical protein PVIIG_05695 [Plasmodium vivax India VII]
MECSEDLEEGNYFFFDNVLQYIEKADNAKIDLTSDGAYSCCESFYNLWNSKLNTEENAKTICKQFIKLYKSLPHIKGLSNNDLACKKDCGFFNYWLNFKLYNNVINNDICVFTFYNELESHCSEELQHSLSKCKMCNIMKDELDNMTILYNLHNKRNEINTIINLQRDLERSKLNELSSECSTKYKKGLAMCHNKDDKFCELLENFKKKYEELYPTVETKGHDYSKYFKRLSGDENINMISTAVIGSAVVLIPLLGILYKVSELNIKL